MIEPGTDQAEVEATLVSAARDGNRAAFAELHGRWARTIHGVLLASVPRHDVDDLMQDVFLKAFRKLASLRDDLAFGGWLLQIARNRAADYHHRAAPPRARFSRRTFSRTSAIAGAPWPTCARACRRVR